MPFRRVPGCVRRLIALILVALWLPVTAHCSLEAMTGLFDDGCENACSHGADRSHADVCDLVERGNFTATGAIVHAPAPSLTTLVCLSCLHARLLADAEPLAPPAWAGDHPRDWVPSWTFALRTALPARAPDLI